MPRTPRFDYPSARQHVMNRGARRAPIFVDDLSCGRFLELLGELPERFGVAVHGYALMPNHFHLLLESRSGRLSQAIAYLQRSYSRWLNGRYEWDGPLYRGRFRNRVVEDDHYWRHLLAYVHLNPVRAHLVGSPDKADWTSHGAYVGLAPQPRWLCCDELLGQYGGVEEYRAYVQDLQYGRSVSPTTFDPDGIWDGQISGIVALRRAAAPEASPTPRPWDDADESGRVETAIAELVQVLDSPREEILRPVTGRRGNRARWVAAWWLTWGGRVSGIQASQLLGIRRSGVSQLAAKARIRRVEDPDLDAWMTELEKIHRT